MNVDVIVPVRDGGERFRACLTAIRSQGGDVVPRIIVVDNGSTDDSLAAAHELADVVLVEPRPGSYAARNRGVTAVSADVVAFTDADCIPSPTWLAAAVAALDAGADLCGGAVVHEHATTRAGRFDELCYLDQRTYVERWGFAATANLVVRRAVIDELGSFRSDMVSSGDVEFCLRARERGFRLCYCPSAIVTHEARATTREVLRKAWRHGRGHGQLEQVRPDDHPWPLRWTRLAPSRHTVKAHWKQPGVIALEVANNWAAVLGHLVERRRRA